MRVTWLHVSDFHIRAADPYDREGVLRALVESVARFRRQGRAPELVFATGDVAFSGKAAEYKIATEFFDALLEAAKLDRSRLFVIPGNHDVDRDMGIGLARTLASREEADAYFGPTVPKPHLIQKLGAYINWHNDYFDGIRRIREDSTCGPVEVLEIQGRSIGVLPLNTALFCQGDDDHGKLMIGRRCLDVAIAEFRAQPPDLTVALVHHPLDWLSDVERSNVTTILRENVDLILRGHLHETDIESALSPYGGYLHIAAGAAYQTRKWPNRAVYGSFDGTHLTVFPIRYEDQPREIWTTDPSLFPHDPGHERHFPVPRLAAPGVEQYPGSPVRSAGPFASPRFRSNVPTLNNLPFVGREELLQEILSELGDPSGERVLVLHGQPGVGKSEVAREFARRQRNRYPGGTFFIPAGGGAEMVDLARIGANFLNLDFPPDLPIRDQCERTLLSLGAAPVLLIYDNAASEESVRPWLPPAGMPCHVLITSHSERWGPGWPLLAVEPLTPATSLDLIERLAGREVTDRYGAALAGLAGGLPIQICSAAATLAYEARRGRLDSSRLTITSEARKSFTLVYEHLEDPVRLLVHTAALLNPQRILRHELALHLEEVGGWSEMEFQRRLDACLDIHLLEGGAELRMHQLFASFLLATPLPADVAATLLRIREVQRTRLVELATELVANPANSELAAAFMGFRLRPEVWDGVHPEVSVQDREEVGVALLELGKFEEARLWYERAVEQIQQGDPVGRVNYDRLARGLHMIGFCLWSEGKFKEARSWLERAAEATQKGNIDGQVDHDALGKHLYQVGLCLSRENKLEEARQWYEQAVEAMQQGDALARRDHECIGRSLHEVGRCLVHQGNLEEAHRWYERAVEEKEQGDADGYLDNGSLGKSLHEVGCCLWKMGNSEAALPWLLRAVEAKAQGDIHGRIDHESLGSSLHEIGSCLADQLKFEEAQPWFERAVQEHRLGDLYGHVNPRSLRTSLRSGAACLRKLGQSESAQVWEDEAAQFQL